MNSIIAIGRIYLPGAALLAVLALPLSPATAQVSIATEGQIESGAGFKFPDGSVQTTAITSQIQPSNIIWVAKSGGDFTTMGAALSSILDNGPDNRYQIRVAPGEYSEIVNMKAYVDIVGSGRNVTRLTHNGGSSNQVVNTANNVELRDLTVENDGSGSSSFALAINNSATAPRISNVDAMAFGASFNYSIYVTNGSHPTLTNVNSVAVEGSSAVGMYIFSSDVTARDSSFSALDDTNGNGIYSTHGGGDTYTITLIDSVVEGSSTIIRGSSANTFLISGSKLYGDGAINANSGTFSCVFSYDGALAPLASDCDGTSGPDRDNRAETDSESSPPAED